MKTVSRECLFFKIVFFKVETLFLCSFMSYDVVNKLTSSCSMIFFKFNYYKQKNKPILFCRLSQI